VHRAEEPEDVLLELPRRRRLRYARITAKWYVRGGITTNVVAEQRKKGWKPAATVALPDVPAQT
jgi:7-cyano-7-deazaguanine reductase